MNKDERFTYDGFGLTDHEHEKRYIYIKEMITLLNILDVEIKDIKQTMQDYEDLVSNWFIDNWNDLPKKLKESASLELGIDELQEVYSIDFDSDDYEILGFTFSELIRVLPLIKAILEELNVSDPHDEIELMATLSYLRLQNKFFKYRGY